MLDTARIEDGGYHTEVSYALLFQRPRDLINVGGRPAAAAVVAAPILKL